VLICEHEYCYSDSYDEDRGYDYDYDYYNDKHNYVARLIPSGQQPVGEVQRLQCSCAIALIFEMEKGCGESHARKLERVAGSLGDA
jgi:hypothetical protein